MGHARHAEVFLLGIAQAGGVADEHGGLHTALLGRQPGGQPAGKRPPQPVEPERRRAAVAQVGVAFQIVGSQIDAVGIAVHAVGIVLQFLQRKHGGKDLAGLRAGEVCAGNKQVGGPAVQLGDMQRAAQPILLVGGLGVGLHRSRDLHGAARQRQGRLHRQRAVSPRQTAAIKGSSAALAFRYRKAQTAPANAKAAASQTAGDGR